MRPTHIIESNLLYSNSKDLNVILMQKHFPRNTRLISGQLSGYLMIQHSWNMQLTITMCISWFVQSDFMSGCLTWLLFLFFYFFNFLNSYIFIFFNYGRHNNILLVSGVRWFLNTWNFTINHPSFIHGRQWYCITQRY